MQISGCCIREKIFVFGKSYCQCLPILPKNFPARKIAILILPKNSSLRKVFKIDSSQNSQSGKNLQKWFFLKFPDWKNPTLPRSGFSLYLHSYSFFPKYPNWEILLKLSQLKSFPTSLQSLLHFIYMNVPWEFMTAKWPLKYLHIHVHQSKNIIWTLSSWFLNVHFLANPFAHYLHDFIWYVTIET